MRFKQSWIQTAILSLFGALAFSPAAQAKDVIVKIGHVAPLSGPQAHYGKDNERGARMAIEDLNAMKIQLDGGTAKFELVPEDDAADPKTGAIVAQKLCDAKVNGVIGHLNSGTTIPASRIYYNCGIPEISPSATNPKITQQGFDSFFRVIANDSMLGVALAKYALNEVKAKRVVVIDDRTGYGQPLADIFSKQVAANGGKVIEREYTNDKATDFSAILTSVKRSNPDLVFYGGMDAQAGPMLRQMKALGINAKLMGGDGICTTELMKLGGDNVGPNVLCAEGGMALSKMPGGPAFEARYKKEFNADIQVYAPFVYDATMTMGMAMKEAGSADPKKYLPKLRNINYKGVIGTISFDKNGDIKNGAITINSYNAQGKTPVAILQ
ncbi:MULTISPECIES: branched-chain amino acid ABC transporter substrate-binding protein [Limnobacter]|uniref:Branched chain amino acid ABC transporter substrate-binding protein n=1 Tax=Limnobacter litoralis TaxID=481366 RepID=A0ABQ5YTB3_9BURK|nr:MULTISPECIES: branched-chain amino acid ABC transporter substrate-binding protein [Limnobacter]GLR26676.1 branched chain amino acid ABC transporter substrate-binding protein [Limnobacter litoralis]HEX5487493.1 branched-chain amino acid ABC transporter substrate-binding protein [Limnobacter sp.]